MSYEEELESSREKLAKLKANLYIQMIRGYVARLRDNWKPKVKCIEGSQGEPLELYYDEYRHEWTTEDIAFQGHVFNKVKDIINK